jgi:hypothetical protein
MEFIFKGGASGTTESNCYIKNAYQLIVSRQSFSRNRWPLRIDSCQIGSFPQSEFPAHERFCIDRRPIAPKICGISCNQTRVTVMYRVGSKISTSLKNQLTKALGHANI